MGKGGGGGGGGGQVRNSLYQKGVIALSMNRTCQGPEMCTRIGRTTVSINTGEEVTSEI